MAQLTHECYRRALRGQTIAEIAVAVHASPRTVERALTRARKLAREGRSTQQQQDDLQAFIDATRLVVAAAWADYDVLQPHARNRTKNLEIIAAAIERIGKAQGVFVAKQEPDQSLDLLMQLINTPQTVVIEPVPAYASLYDDPDDEPVEVPPVFYALPADHAAPP